MIWYLIAKEDETREQQYIHAQLNKLIEWPRYSSCITMRLRPLEKTYHM